MTGRSETPGAGGAGAASAALPDTLDAVLLDAGGVLLDLDYRYLARLIEPRFGTIAVETLARAESQARSEVNRTILARRRPSEPWRHYFRLLLGHAAVPDEHHEPIIDALWSAHRKVGLWTAAAEGALDSVRALRQTGVRLGVVSNAEGQVRRDLESAGFGEVLETVVDSTEEGVEKPDPAIFRVALERMDLRPERTLFVGDMPAIDVVGARNAGIAPVLLDRHGIHGDVDCTRIASMGELPGLVRPRVAES